MSKHSKLYNKLIKYITAAILIAVPLYPKFPFINIPGTFVAIRLEDFLIAVGGLLILPKIYNDIKQFFRSDIARSIVIYLFIGFVSLTSAVLVTKTVVPTIGTLHWLRRIEYFIPLFLGYYSIRSNKNNFQYYLKLLFIIIIMIFIYGYGQKNYSFPIIITQNAEYSAGVALRYIPGAHINSTFAGHYDLATFLVLLMPVIVVFFSSARSWFERTFYLLVWLAGLWLLVNSASRISLASYIGASTLALVFIRKYKYIPVLILVSILFINFSSNLIARYTRLFEVTLSKISIEIDNEFVALAQDGSLPERRDRPEPTPTPPPRFEDRSTNIRLDVEWPRAIRALKKNPLIGTGYSSITLATDNDYLRALGETGLLGFFAFLLLGFRVFKRFIFNYPFKKLDRSQRHFLFGIMGGVSGILVNAVFIDIFEASKFAIIFWLIIGISVALMNRDKKEYI